MSAQHKVRTEPKLISKRVHFTSLRQLVEQLIPEWREGAPDFVGKEGWEKLREAFYKFGDHLMEAIQNDLEEGSKRGIAEAINLIRDPDFYEVKKKRNQKWNAQMKASQVEQDAIRDRHNRGEYTEEEIEQMIKQAERDIEWHTKSLAGSQQKLFKLQNAKPMTPNVEIVWPEDLFQE